VVLYRLTCMILAAGILLSTGGSGEAGWDEMLLLGAAYLATALTCIPVSRWLAKRAPATKKSSIVGSVVASFLITLLAGVILLPFGWLGMVLIQSAIVFLNAPGLAWGWIAGELRWRSFQLRESNAVDK
jgi:hypothetical protein